MATKTISLRIEAYDRLRQARLRPDESFSDVVLRARWDTVPLTAGELLASVRERGPGYSAEGLAAVEALKASDRAPRDKWSP
ncbi:MAG TPA: hypothetical protein VGA37_15120 [Gemmatimonadales bacterium]